MKESHRRSVIKGISWRALGTIDTIVISFLISGKLSYAVSIGAVEVVTKIFLFYFHERIWIWSLNKFNLFDSHWLSFTKGISWRFLGTLDTMMISFIITGKLTTAISIGMVEVFTKIILFYVHERAWNMVPWGRSIA
ncbi:DUF2061 domain-containing protein [Cytophagaceae bacterium ABcell3]|nr:DUF2061 domain-containing protein [Cytophagaceae bacterium ABcell3]